MPNSSFRFKQFTINQAHSVFKVGTDGVLLGAAAGLEGGGKILDIGTGTGLIAIMAAQRSDGEIVAIEPDEGSFADACANVADCRWNDRIKVINLSLQEMDASYRGTFDVIL
jgi:tRNA1Val (adenine37-N6)-methyltransferase